MQTSYQHTNIAKNSIILYLRMIVTTLISLYTSRVVLNLLGLSDFGTYSVVAGIIEFAAIFTGSMTSATQRFLAFELGRHDFKEFNRAFCSLSNIFFIFCTAILLIGIPVGLWMVHGFLDIPAERIYAASWVLIGAIISFELTTMATPYMSAIIAHEHMGVYTCFSISEAILKLLATLMLFLYDGDKLIAYALSLVALRAILNGAIVVYCRRNIEGCRYHFFWDWEKIKNMASFSGWTLIGSTSYVLMTQGHSILLNIFFGTIINAAKGIADRVKNFSMIFSQNVFLAITPQLTKSYAAGDINYLKSIVFASSRLSFMLLALVTFPLIMEMRPILTLWLGEAYVTDESTAFSIFSIIFVLISTIEAPLTKVVQASGQVKTYEIIVGCATLSFVPISYIFLKMGFPAISTYITMNTLYFLIIGYRLFRVKQLVNFSYYIYLQKVFAPIIVVCIILIVGGFYTRNYLTELMLFFRLAIWLTTGALVIWTVGVSRQEKDYCKQHAANYLRRKA